MADQNQQQFEGALDSIFNFIYQQRDKPPQNPPPIKIKPGATGTDSLSNALGEMVSKPFLYAGDMLENTISAVKSHMYNTYGFSEIATGPSCFPSWTPR